MSLLDIFRKGAPLVRSPKDQAAVARGNPIGDLRGPWMVHGIQIISPQTEFNATTAMTHPMVSRVIDKIGGAVAGVKWYARRKGKTSGADAAPDEIELKLNTVLSAPCDDFSPAFTRFWMAANLALYGHAPLKYTRSVTGIVNAFYPLRNRGAMMFGDATGRVVGYKFPSGSGGYLEFSNRYAVQKAEQNGATGTRPWVEVIARPGVDVLSLDNALTKAAELPADIFTLLLQRARDTASGHPNKKVVFTAPTTFDETEMKDLKAMFDKSIVGAENSGQAGFLSGTDVNVLQIDNDLSDIHSKMPLDDMARQIAGIFGVPAQLMGLGGADAAKYAANYVEGRIAFFQDTIIPFYLDVIADAMTMAMCPPGYEIYFDLESVEAMRQYRVQRMQELKDVDFLTANEKRAMFGFKPVAWGDEQPTPAKAPAQLKPPPN